MNIHDMTEQAYRNGYAKGYADAKKNEKHGRWVQDQVECVHPILDYESCWRDVVQCSVCEEYFDVSDARNFCPNCGAIMDLPNITENTRQALEKMGENVHSGIDFDYAAED